MSYARILIGDPRDILATLAADSVDLDPESEALATKRVGGLLVHVEPPSVTRPRSDDLRP